MTDNNQQSGQTPDGGGDQLAFDKKKKGKKNGKDASLNINSLMDALTILLV